MININATYLAHAARVTVGADESLCYVTVDRFKDGALLVATNGHVAVAYYDRTAFIDKWPYFVVVGDDIKKAASKKANAGRKLTIDNDGTCTFQQKSGSVIRQENCLVRPSVKPFDFKAYMLARIHSFEGAKALPTALFVDQINDLADDKNATLVFYQTAQDNGPVFVKNVNNPDFFGIIMPIRLKGTDCGSYCTLNNGWVKELVEG